MRPLTLRVVVLRRVTIGGIQNTCDVVGENHFTPWSGVVDRWKFWSPRSIKVIPVYFWDKLLLKYSSWELSTASRSRHGRAFTVLLRDFYHPSSLLAVSSLTSKTQRPGWAAHSPFSTPPFRAPLNTDFFINRTSIGSGNYILNYVKIPIKSLVCKSMKFVISE